jgi:hypothetical protein
VVAAFVEHSFKRGFLLDEPRLRKLKDIIESREIKSRYSKVVYRVYRGDSYSYETESVDDVVNEDNEDWRRITRLDVRISQRETEEDQENRLRFLLSFSDKEGCELRITAENRDRVFLLFSDLREYIQHEVTVTRQIDEGQGRVLGMVLSVAIILATLLSTMYLTEHFDPELSRQALNSPDIATKLNFLISHRERTSFNVKSLIIAGVGMMISLAVLFGSVGAIVSFIFPGNVFLFGKRKETFEKRQRLTSNLLWIVGAGLIVSVVAGFIVWRFTSRH